MTTRSVLVLAFLFSSCISAFAQAPSAPTPAAPATEPDYPIIRVGVLSYVQYDAELKNRQGFNAFDLTRGYININGQLASNVRFRVTPDVRRITDSSLAGTLVLRIKYAFSSSTT
jgi:curli biogenesis system outer membrane secretion channel CsgG